ncbi:helicase-related protein [Thermodesulfobium narugense]|nr:helicase-related protein [Thermodesulfobium narugense]
MTKNYIIRGIKINTDLTFITNENGQSLLERFKVLIKDAEFFDCLVGYFYTSGFHNLYEAFVKTKRIRILIGIGTDKKTHELIRSYHHVKEVYSDEVKEEIEDSENKYEVEKGIELFKEWLKSGKIQIKAYPERNLHAKLYIMSFSESDRDAGRVITGSSNFSQSGLSNNLEFNVELKNVSDYKFAKEKFEELWENSVDVSEDYITTIEQKTWLRNDISPYELFLKFLYEYFKRDLEESGELYNLELPNNFLQLEYQKQAVINARRILEEYGGVFLSDVVGLGKTYMAAMLASQLDGRTLILASPVLINPKNPGSWVNVFREFNLKFDTESIGQLKRVKETYNLDKYKNIIIDESHKFRTEDTVSYTLLSEICRGKRIILVSATPYNNSPQDILSQIKLFQSPRKSTIPGIIDLESFFNNLKKKLKSIDKKENPEKYIEAVKENAYLIREKILKYLMIRRTRSEIEKYFPKDLEKNKLKFPQVNDPIALFYELNDEENKIFDETIRLITKQISYARYTPLLYLKSKDLSIIEKYGQLNMGTFMKVLLVKRLESSFHAFRLTIDRFIDNYKKFIDEFKKGNVYISKKYTNKIFEYIENDDDEAIQKLIEEDKAERYSSDEFEERFKEDLERDYETFSKIKTMWGRISRDPKLKKLLEQLKTNKILKDKKLIIFSESKDTVNYIAEKIENDLNKKILVFSSSSSEKIKDIVIENFDANSNNQKDEYNILISTEVLSEGVNLHRSNVIINYDIPWNPTRMMQRVGRINRVGTKFDELFVFNFFPTQQSNDQIKLQEIAKSKIEAFLTLLGDDAAVLTEDEPIGSHELFGKLTSKTTITGESEIEESELKYFRILQDIREKNPDLFQKIKYLPKKARSAKISHKKSGLLTYFRKGKVEKFYLAKRGESTELDFMSAASLLESAPEDLRVKLPENFYDLLNLNTEQFSQTLNSTEPMPTRRGRDKSLTILRYLKAIDKTPLTDTQEQYIETLQEKLENGEIPKKTLTKILQSIENLKEQKVNSLKILGAIQSALPERLLKEHYSSSSSDEDISNKTEVILSMYLKEGQ